MADSWEDWDDDEPTVGGLKITQKVEEDIQSKFADEEKDLDSPKWQKTTPKPQPKAKPQSKYDESRGVSTRPIEEPLDDPVAEKLRQQRLVEESDLQSALSLFGAEGVQDLDSLKPKSAKDFEEFAQALAAKYLAPHVGSTHYKLLLKQLCRAALKSLSATETKDVETSIAGLRTEKVKEEKAAAIAGKKATKKATLNVGRGGGSAGLEDYVYDNTGQDDEYDFM